MAALMVVSTAERMADLRVVMKVVMLALLMAVKMVVWKAQ
jgi:hypothetical protein